MDLFSKNKKNMLKDIPELIVEDIAVAIVKEKNEEDEEVWNVYFLNLKNEPVEGVLVSSNGYGELEGEKRKTSTLRHFLDVVDGRSFSKIEPIMENVFGLSNEYWVSFYYNRVMYDKKYVFLPDSIRKDNYTNIPLLNKKGIMIK